MSLSMSFSKRVGSTRERSANVMLPPSAPAWIFAMPSCAASSFSAVIENSVFSGGGSKPKRSMSSTFSASSSEAGAAVRDALVVHEPHVHVGHVVFGNQCGEADLDLGPMRERILEIGLVAGAQRRDGAPQAARCRA